MHRCNILRRQPKNREKGNTRIVQQVERRQHRAHINGRCFIRRNESSAFEEKRNSGRDNVSIN